MSAATVAYGINAFVGFGTETTYGTPVAATKYFRPLSGTLSLEKPPKFVSRLSTATSRTVVNGKKSVAGGIKLAVPYNSFGLLLYYVLGAKAVTGSGPYTHTITPGTLKSFTTELNPDAGSIGGSTMKQFSGNQIQSMKLSNGIEGQLECDLTLLGCTEALIALSSPSYPTEFYPSWDQLTAGTINGVTVPAKMTELTISNTLSADRFNLGSLVRRGLGRIGGSVSGKFTYEYNVITQHSLFTASTDAPIEMTWGDGTRSLDLTLAHSQITSDKQDPSGPDVIMEEVSFEGDLGDLTATLVNSDSAYT